MLIIPVIIGVVSSSYTVKENGDGYVRAELAFEAANVTENIMQLELTGPLIKWIYSEDENVKSAYKERTLDPDMRNITVFTFSNEDWNSENVTVPFNFTYDSAGEDSYNITLILNENVLYQNEFSFEVLDPSGSVDEAFNETTAVPTSIDEEEEEIKVLTKEEVLEVSDHNYKWLIRNSLLFYEAQRSGNLTDDNRVKWRGDSLWFDHGTTQDGKRVDLSGGYYDAGDTIKFGFPLAYTMTILAWGGIDFYRSYEMSDEITNLLKAVKWGIDWMDKAVIRTETDISEVFVQVGDPDEEHKLWNRPEDFAESGDGYFERPAFSLTKDKGGTDCLMEYVAAFAATSLLYKRAHENGIWDDDGSKLLELAERLYAWTDDDDEEYTYYHDNVPLAAEFYASHDYKDEIVWAGIWLYRASGKQSYYDDTRGRYYNWGQFSRAKSDNFSWDSKTLGTQLLLTQVTRDALRIQYMQPLVGFCGGEYKNKGRFTPEGLWWYSEWSPTRYSANVAFLCFLISEYTFDPVPENFARQQAEYFLGSSGRSYVIGYGDKWPQTPHHRASSCPAPPEECGDKWAKMSLNNKPNINTLFGALVGGPDKMDNFKNDRENYRTNEVALDYNAAYQGLMAALLERDLEEAGRIAKDETYSAIPDDQLQRAQRYDVPPDPVDLGSAFSSLSLILLTLILFM